MAGFSSRAAPIAVDVAIIGAGFSGLCAAIELQREGRRSYVVLEKAADLGGTWRENTYPGVECDVPSHLYSYSFAPSAHWSKRYGTGAEIHAYLRTCAEQYQVLDHLRFDQRVEGAEWDGSRWILVTASGERYIARFLVAGVGGLHTPNIPALPGLSDFAGPAFHTSRWRHDVDLTGKRVGIIGTGATAVQAAPEVADVAGSLHVLQRSPTWVGPKYDQPYAEADRERFQRDPRALHAHRWDLWRRWETNGVDVVRAGTPSNVGAELAARTHIRSSVADPELAARLTPDYNFTCKRPTFSNRYYAMFNREHVHLVTDPIERILERGLAVRGGVIDLDVLILATGFQAFDITADLNLRGVGGVSLTERWQPHITTYRSVMVDGFPNLFILLGPNSAGLTSAVQMIEAQTRFALRAMDHVDESAAAWLQPRREAIERFTDRVQAATALTTVNRGCRSFWTDDDGFNHVVWPESSVTFRQLMRHFCPADFDVA